MNGGFCKPPPPVSADSDEGTSKHRVNVTGDTAKLGRQSSKTGLDAWNTHKLISTHSFSVCPVKICPVIDKQAPPTQRQEARGIWHLIDQSGLSNDRQIQENALNIHQVKIMGEDAPRDWSLTGRYHRRKLPARVRSQPNAVGLMRVVHALDSKFMSGRWRPSLTLTSAMQIHRNGRCKAVNDNQMKSGTIHLVAFLPAFTRSTLITFG